MSNTPKVAPLSVIEQSGPRTAHDGDSLARLGKNSVLKRNFGFLTILGFSCTVLITWEGSLILFLSGLSNGGPAGIIYGFLVVWAGTLSIFATLSELASMAPTSGGQYHWASMLAPASSRKFIGYITAWLTLTGWQSLLASGGHVTGTLIQGLIVLTHPDYLENWKDWHGTLLFWAVILLTIVINTVIGSVLAKFEGFVLVVHLLGFCGVMLPLLMLGEHADSSFVFETFLNLGEWKTQGLSFCVGILGNIFAFLGGDGAIHMSEEIRNASLVIPRSLMTGIMINGTLGFGMLVATLYCMGDIEEALMVNPTYPFMAIFHRAVGSTSAAAAMSAFVVVMAFSATTGCVASTSRIYWAFARDNGLPFSEFICQINPRTSIPLNAVVISAVIACILALVNIGNAVAFHGVISIAIAGLFGSYFVVAVLLLYRRLNGTIYLPSEDDTITNTPGARLTWGPWRLPGAFGIANNVFTCAFVLFVFFFSFWPSTSKVTPSSMNWAVLVTPVVLMSCVFYYVIWARHVYKGPIIEFERQQQLLYGNAEG
ncbi:putative GABA permease [Corynespora cassiicola Philippines]|uniref:Putative GABA permease n=1 Tax=Corynespora cassiicola Philippines TaxID=1448308 RepID=A0A2T2N676_CORCC|nr:putative GABA permease [Corynespora cassiicola Philippines]